MQSAKVARGRRAERMGASTKLLYVREERVKRLPI